MDYDTIYEKFCGLSGYSYDELPQTDELRYRLINNGVALYNSKSKKYSDILLGGAICNNNTETISVELPEIDLMILAYLMGELTASNKYTEFTALWSTIANETGLQDYKSQVATKEGAIYYFRNKINALIDDEISTFD